MSLPDQDEQNRPCLPGASSASHPKISNMSSIHPLSALSLAALDLVPSADICVMRAMGLNAPVFNAGVDIALFSRGQVWDAIVSMGDPEEAGCLGAGRFESLIHIRRVGFVAGSRFAEGVQADVVVCGGQLGGSYCCHGGAQTGTWCVSQVNKGKLMDGKRVRLL